MSVLGLRVGPFEIVAEARVPEEGSWYLGRRTGMTRRQPGLVLVCLLPPDADAEARASLQRRFEALRAVEGPRVPEPVAFFEGIGAMAVGAARGTPLSVAIDGRRTDAVKMSPATLLDVVLEIAETLQHAHHKGKVHGHLDPERVLLSADGKVWVWGYSDGPGHATAAAWTPPERARGEAPSEATDQWALGALAAALVTGTPPWRGDHAAEALRGEIDPIVEPVERQWPALGRTLRRMLDPRPANRYPSMHPVRQELLALSRKAGGTSDRRELGSALAAASPADMGPFEDELDEDAKVGAASPGPEPLEADGPMPVEVEAELTVEPTADTQHAREDAVVTRPAPPFAPRVAPRPASQVLAVPEAAAEPLAPQAAVVEAELSDPGVREAVVGAPAARLEEPEATRRHAAKLPEEQIPVVRPELPGEMPVARISEPNAARAASPGVQVAAAPAIQPPAASAVHAPAPALSMAPSFTSPTRDVDPPSVSDPPSLPPMSTRPAPVTRTAGGAIGVVVASAGLPSRPDPSPLQPDLEPSEATMLFDEAMLRTLPADEMDAPAPRAATPPPAPKVSTAPVSAAPPQPPSAAMSTPPKPTAARPPGSSADPFDASNLATPMYPDRRDGDGEDEEHATVVFDTSNFGEHLQQAVAQYDEDDDSSSSPVGRTVVPGTDASDGGDDFGPSLGRPGRSAGPSDTSVGDPSTGDGRRHGRNAPDWTGGPSAGGDHDGPALGDVADAVDMPRLPETQPSVVTRAAPILVLVMLVLMIVYVVLRFF